MSTRMHDASTHPRTRLRHEPTEKRIRADVTQLSDLIAFYDDVLDVTVDGVRRQRPDTAVAKALLDEFGV